MTGYPGVGHGSEPDRRGKVGAGKDTRGTSLVILGLDHIVVLIEDIVADTQAYGRDSGKHVPQPLQLKQRAAFILKARRPCYMRFFP